jgi:NADH-quinone oxidoreductase subunit M
VQPDLKKLVAYSSVSHLGFVVLGLCAMNAQGVQGSIYQMLNHGVSTGGLFMIVGMLSDRRHTRLISEFGGLKAVMPRFVAAFLLVTLSSIALPGMNGFVGEFLILLGGFLWNVKFAAIAATGVILSAIYMLWMFQRVNFGDVTNSKNTSLPDLLPREWALMVPTIAMAIVMGILPNVFLRPMEPSVKRTIERVTGRSFATTQAAPGSRLLASGQQPVATSKRPAVRSQQREADTQQAASSGQQPIAKSRQPGASSQQPAATSRPPTASSESAK